MLFFMGLLALQIWYIVSSERCIIKNYRLIKDKFWGRQAAVLLKFQLIYLFVPWRSFRKSPTSIPSLHINSFYEFSKTVNVAATTGSGQSM
jgi:hypothetical protein